MLAWMQAAFAVLSAVLKAVFDAYLFATTLGQHEQGPAVSIIVPVGLCCCVARSWEVWLANDAPGACVARPLDRCTYSFICLRPVSR